jgi:uncharacterized RDD family membrane protein YckC
MGQKRPAGLWIRFCAGLIDLALSAVTVILIAEGVGEFGVYIPIEITVIAVYAAYTGVGIAWKGRTLGKAALGLQVTRRNGASVGPVRAAVRAVLVALFQCLLGLPLLVMGGGSSKRGWHDRLTGTVVLCQDGLTRRRRITFAAVMTLVSVYLGFSASDIYRLYQMHHAWTADAEVAMSRTPSGPKGTIDAASVDAAQRKEMAAWLAEHGDDPVKTVIDLASTHQVTIIGEIHGKKAYLDFFNEIIPDLYNKAGVRTLAIECCHPDQNGDLARLVQGRQFDRGLLLALARASGWRAWGYKGYWDVLETVWRVNQTRPQGSEPLRVVGISPRFDGPSLVLVDEGPWYERLRLVRLRGLARLMFFPNAYYARGVEREAFDKGQRTVVWVGAAHAALCPSGRTQGNDGAVGGNHYMASMLLGRYGSAVGQVILPGEAKTDRVAALIGESAQQCSKTRIAFTTADSPFARLRDAEASDYRYRPGRGLADLASHYIMLTPEEGLQECDWMEGFLSQRMLGRNRPYYELLAGGPIDDLTDGNRRIAEGARRL